MVADDPDRHVEVSINDFKEREGDIRNRLTQPIKDILLSLVWFYPEEYEVLQILALGDAKAVERYRQDNPDSLTQFERYGILKDGSTAAFAITDLRTFIERHGDEYEREISPFRSSDVPPEALPEAPDLETLSKLYQKRGEVEGRLRRVIFLYLAVSTSFKPKKLVAEITKGLHKRADRPDPSALFIGQTPQEAMNQLYLLDLKSIVLAHWKEFAPLFDGNKAQFELIMDTINLGRKADAHLHTVSDDEVEHFNASYGWMLHKLKQVTTY